MVPKRRKLFMILILIMAGISLIKTFHLFFRDFNNNEIFKSVSKPGTEMLYSDIFISIEYIKRYGENSPFTISLKRKNNKKGVLPSV